VVTVSILQRFQEKTTSATCLMYMTARQWTGMYSGEAVWDTAVVIRAQGKRE